MYGRQWSEYAPAARNQPQHKIYATTNHPYIYIYILYTITKTNTRIPSPSQEVKIINTKYQFDSHTKRRNVKNATYPMTGFDDFNEFHKHSNPLTFITLNYCFFYTKIMQKCLLIEREKNDKKIFLIEFTTGTGACE